MQVTAYDLGSQLNNDYPLMTIKATLCNFDGNPSLLQTKLNDAH